MGHMEQHDMGIELPEHLRSGPLADEAKKALSDAASMASASNSVPRISLRGREFRLVQGGDEVARYRDYLDMIILGVEPEAGRMIKTFYKNGYSPGAKEPPTCASEDGVAPGNWVQEKQNPICGTCPHNVFGSSKGPTGKPSKACRDSKRAWVVLSEGNVAAGTPPGAAAKSLPSISERTMFGLNITVASLKAFSDHGKRLAALGQGPAVCVTRAKMLDTEYPQLDFEIAAWLSAEDAPQSLKLSASRPWKISYANAGLALAMGEEGTTKAQLPMAVPDHLKNLATTTAEDSIAAAPKPRVDSKTLDDKVKDW